MKRFLIPVMAFGVLASATIAAGPRSDAQTQQQQPPVFRAKGDTVPVFVTVLDKTERLVPDLTKEDFELRDSGKVQPITLFDNSPQPVRIVVLLDLSGSMRGNMPLMRSACDQLLRELNENDKARFGTFGKEITITPEFSNDGAALMASLPQDIDPDAPTPLWRAVYQAMDGFSKVDDGRKVVLILSDGYDSPGLTFKKNVSQVEVIDRAQSEGVMIYGVGMRGRNAGVAGATPGANLGALMAADMPDPGLGTAATATGGGYFELRPREDLGATFGRVARELHSQYLLGFVPTQMDGKEHKLEVRVTKEGGYKPRARKSYVAPKKSS